MGEIILANAVERKEGYIYYVDGEGNVCEAVMARGRKKKEHPQETKLQRMIRLKKEKEVK